MKGCRRKKFLERHTDKLKEKEVDGQRGEEMEEAGARKRRHARHFNGYLSAHGAKTVENQR